MGSQITTIRSPKRKTNMDAVESQPSQQEVVNADGQQGATPEAGNEAVSLENLQKRYEASSKAGKDNYERAIKAEAEAKVLREQLQSSSLTSKENEQRPVQFPEETQAVRSLIEHAGFTQEQAKVIYDRDRAFFNEQQQLRMQNQALANILKFNREQSEKGLIALDPLAKEASDFFEGIPELEALPAAEKRDRYLKIQQKGVKTSGRDTTAAKMAAGGSIGGNAQSRGAAAASTSSEELARLAGLPSGKAFEEFANVRTAEDNAAWRKKFNIK